MPRHSFNTASSNRIWNRSVASIIFCWTPEDISHFEVDHHKVSTGVLLEAGDLFRDAQGEARLQVILFLCAIGLSHRSFPGIGLCE